MEWAHLGTLGLWRAWGAWRVERSHPIIKGHRLIPGYSAPGPTQWLGQFCAATWVELGELSHPRDGQGAQAQRALPGHLCPGLCPARPASRPWSQDRKGGQQAAGRGVTWTSYPPSPVGACVNWEPESWGSGDWGPGLLVFPEGGSLLHSLCLCTRPPAFCGWAPSPVPIHA